MPDQFVVRSKTKASSWPLDYGRGLPVLIAALSLSISIPTLLAEPEPSYGSCLATGAALAILWTYFAPIWSSRQNIDLSVTITDEYAHISRRPANGTLMGTPTTLKKGDIVDCVVSELVLPHKVASVVVFRLRPGGGDSMRLVEAFPGAELTYVECLVLRNEIMKSIR